MNMIVIGVTQINLLGPGHRKCPEIWNGLTEKDQMIKRDERPSCTPRASAICTPAIADGLSRRTSASLHAFQASTRTTNNEIVICLSNLKSIYDERWSSQGRNCSSVRKQRLVRYKSTTYVVQAQSEKFR